MRISYKLDVNDFVSAQHMHYWHRFPARINLILCYGVFPLLGTLGMFLWVTSLITHSAKPFTTSFVVSILVLCAIPAWFYFNLRRCYRRSRVSDENCIIDFGEDHIQTELPGHSKSTLEWAAVKSFYEGAKIILLYFAPTRFLVIPRRVLTLDGHAELMELLKRKVL